MRDEQKIIRDKIKELEDYIEDMESNIRYAKNSITGMERLIVERKAELANLVETECN